MLPRTQMSCAFDLRCTVGAWRYMYGRRGDGGEEFTDVAAVNDQKTFVSVKGRPKNERRFREGGARGAPSGAPL